MTQKILLCDDQLDNLQLLIDILDDEGYAITATSDPYDALEQAEANHPDLLLLDINMPHMDGIELCRRIKALDHMQNTPVIFLSAFDDTDTRLQGFGVGAVDFVPKPFDVREILARIAKHLEMSEKPKQLAQQVQNMDTAISVTSHDLKNPISNIIMASTLLRDVLNTHGDETQKSLYLVEMIEDSCVKMRDMIDDILELATIQQAATVERTPTPIMSVLGEIREDFQLLAIDKGLRLRFQADMDDDQQVSLAVAYFRRMMHNLISNAIKYTPPNGDVLVHATVRDDQFIVVVDDTGYGIPADVLDKVFNQFFRVNNEQHRKQSGTGLGLSIVKRIVDLHHGQIAVESQIGEGTRFTVRLPL